MTGKKKEVEEDLDDDNPCARCYSNVLPETVSVTCISTRNVQNRIFISNGVLCSLTKTIVFRQGSIMNWKIVMALVFRNLQKSIFCSVKSKENLFLVSRNWTSICFNVCVARKFVY